MLAPGANLSSLSGQPPSNDNFAINKPTLFGHYWRVGKPVIESEMATCLDFSVAAFKPGYLCAYEFRDGDNALMQERLHSVKRS